MNEPFERLLDSFRPSHYELFLQPNRDQLTFTGKVVITGEQLTAQTMIKLHSKGLRIDEAVFSIGGAEHPFVSHKHGDHDILYLAAPIKIQGKLTIHLSFFGEITEPMVGLYISQWQDKQGQTKQIVATQFESHHAREAFPCIDEPAAKAVFDLTLSTPVGETVLANTPLLRQQEADGWLVSTFEPTPVMSTYLLAFVFGELVAAEAKTKSGILTRVWTTPLHSQHTAFALETAVKSLEKLETFFSLPLPLAKIDHVALPDFAAGAMENWGLITYRESMFVVDPTHTTLDDKQNVATVIAHELAHQWFGNLVTMEWWTDLWLNEGFASWLEVFIADQLYPDWQLWDQFISDSYLVAMSMDALESSHAIEIPISDPNDIRSIFDAISYEKGACVLRMLHHYIGHDALRAGLQAYLQAHQYGNATTSDLWTVLERVSQRPVRDFMSKWTTQTGFPLIEAKVEHDHITLSQRRFFINSSAHSEKELWPVPIDSTHGDARLMLTEAEQIWQVADAESIKLNRSQAGFYRTRYDPAHVKRLTARVAQRELGAIDRVGFVSDSFTLAKAGQQATTTALELLASMKEEDNCVVWDVMAGQIGNLRSVFADQNLREAMSPYLRQLISRQLRRLGWNEQANDSHFDKLLRPTILSLGVAAEEATVVQEIDRRFERMRQLHDIQPADIRGIVLSGRAKQGDSSDYEKLLVLHRQTNSAQARNQLAGALCAFRQPELIQRSLSLIASSDVRLQDVVSWVSFIFQNPFAREAAWKWLKDQWPWLSEKFGSDVMTFSAFPKIVGRSFASKQMQLDYQQFFNGVYHEGIDLPIAQGLESLTWQTAWRERDQEALLEYFRGWRQLA